MAEILKKGKNEKTQEEKGGKGGGGNRVAYNGANKPKIVSSSTIIHSSLIAVAFCVRHAGDRQKYPPSFEEKREREGFRKRYLGEIPREVFHSADWDILTVNAKGGGVKNL